MTHSTPLLYAATYEHIEPDEQETIDGLRCPRNRRSRQSAATSTGDPRAEECMAEPGVAHLDIRASAAERKAAVAFERLLSQAESAQSGDGRRAAVFIAGTYNGAAFPFNLFELRSVDVDVSDDMIDCIDAIRWGTSDLHELVRDGEQRVRYVLDRWLLGKVSDSED